ncbi:hypothetical protein [Pararhizobium antarcticum]|uniref:hypothetical protein n=1 Tax=Pararhizobium antarcticum TaxID=1798805 RepID=UPI000B31379E|nr:hypothetical protein [Pararhizobium antarcticum]
MHISNPDADSGREPGKKTILTAARDGANAPEDGLTTANVNTADNSSSPEQYGKKGDAL